MNAVLKYASLVKFAHTVFAMPFAMVGFVYGLRYAPLHNPRWPYIVLVQVILCMVFARNAAMGFNRWADRRIDAENPRTAGREIPAGKIPARHALWFVAVNALLFVATAATINRLAAILSPVALSVILVYSYCKRFTPLAHLVLGLSLGIAPVGAFIAAAGHVVFDGHVVVEPFILALLVTTWCGGFHGAAGARTPARHARAAAQYRHRLRDAQRPGEPLARCGRDRGFAQINQIAYICNFNRLKVR